MPDPYDYIYCLSWKSGRQGGRLLADAPETLSPGVILMEESTGTILYEKNMDEAHYPASITKIMTTLLALENGNLSDMVTFSDDAINNTEGSGIARGYGRAGDLRAVSLWCHVRVGK